MAPTTRLKKSTNEGRVFGRRGGNFESNEDVRPRFRSNPRNSEGDSRGYLSTEKRFGRRGGDRDRDSGFKQSGRRPRNGDRRDFGRDDSGGNRDSGFKQFGRRPRNGDRRDSGRDDSGGNRELRGESKGGRRRKADIPQRSKVIDELRLRGRQLGWKRKAERAAKGEETMGPKPRELRGDRRRTRRDENGVDNNSEGMDGSFDSVEASSDKFKFKWKKIDKKIRDRDGSNFVEDTTSDSAGKEINYNGKGKKMGKGDAKGDLLEKNAKTENESDQVDEEKPLRRSTRVLDKTGKKIRVVQKRTDDGSTEKLVPAKKKKRVIKLDPYDISNKRLDDTAPSTEKNEDDDIEISKNAEFRAIQPSSSILSFVEDNLLGRRRLNELKNAGFNIKLSAPLDNIPFSTSTERERIEDNVFKNKLEFFAAAKISSSFPPPTLPEIAFAGRSNVGKSSLLNALTRQWGVVRTSDKPGLTQTINFFKLASKLCLVDLPGYGFAYAKEEVKDAWEELVKEYVSTRVDLERVCVLVDTKWGMKPRDHELIDLMERSRTPYQIVLTKTDLVFPIDVARRAMQIQENLKKNKSIINPVMMVSSKSGAGVRNLRTVLSKISRFIKP